MNPEDLAFLNQENGATRSARAFRTDLPELLQTDPGLWVAYANGKRLRVAPTQTELYRYCLTELGLQHEEFIVACILPDSSGNVEVPLR